MDTPSEVEKTQGSGLRIAFWSSAILAVVALIFLARLRPSWPWFSLWLFALLGGLALLSLPRVRMTLNLSWFGVTFLVLLGVCLFDLYLFHVETHRQRSERLEVRGVYFHPHQRTIRVGVGYPDLDVRLEGSLYDFDRWSLELRRVETGRYRIQDLDQVDMVRVPGEVWWKPWARVRRPILGARLGRGQWSLAQGSDSVSSARVPAIRLLKEESEGVLEWEGARAPLSREDPLLDRRLSRRLANGIPLADLRWDSLPDPSLARDLVLTRVRTGRSMGRLRLSFPEYRVVSRASGEGLGLDSLPSVQENDTLWVTSRGKSWAFSLGRVTGVSRVAAPVAVNFVRRPRPTGWALPSSEACGADTHRCAVLSTRPLPPPQAHFDLSGFGLDSTRYSFLARLETDGDEVRLIGADFRIHFPYGEIHPVPALAAHDDLPTTGLLVRVSRAVEGQQSAVALTVGLLFLLILGCLTTVSGDPEIWRRRKAATPGVTAAWGFLNVFLIFLGIRLALGLRVAYSPPFYERGAATAVGLWVTFAVMLVALGRWASWVPAFWRTVRWLERPFSRLFLPGVRGEGAPGAPAGLLPGGSADGDPSPGSPTLGGRARTVVGLVMALGSLGLLLWQRPEALPSLLVASTGLGAWLAMGLSRPWGQWAVMNRNPLGVIVAEGEQEDPSLALALTAGGSVVLALAIHAPWMALIPVILLLLFHAVNLLLGRWNAMAPPARRAWSLYTLAVLAVELGVVALAPWPLRSSGGLLLLALLAALLLGRKRGKEKESYLLEVYGGFLKVVGAIFSGVGWAGFLLVLGLLAFLSARAIPPFVRFALVFMLFLLAIRAGLACRRVLEAGGRRGQIQALGILVIPLGVLLVFMLFDFGLGLVFFVPMFLTVLLSARIDRLPPVLMGGSIGVVTLILVVAWSVLNPTLTSLRRATDVPAFSEEFQHVGNGLVDLLRRAGMNGPVTRASIRSIAASNPDLLEEALAFAGPSEALFAAAPSRDQVWGGRAYAASDLTGTGFAGTAVLGRGVPTAVSYAENSYAVYVLSEHGALGGIGVLLAYLGLLVVVGIWIFRVHGTIQDSREGLAVLAMTVGGVLWLVLPAVYVAASNLALVPLTGQNMPFLGLNSWADVVLVSGLSTGIVFGLAALDEKPPSPAEEGGAS